MRIHIIGINYAPEATGIAPFTTGRAEYLASRGHRVTMCTGAPYYPQWRVDAAYRRFAFSRERRAGVDIRRCPMYVPSRVTPARRVVHEATFILMALLRSLFCPRPDLLVIVSPPIGLGVLGWLLARVCWRVPYVLDVEDLQPDTALHLGMIKPGLFIQFLFAVERFAYRHAARISTLTDAMRARIIAKGIPSGKVIVSPSWAEPELFALGDHDAGIRQQLGLGDARLVVHAGNMGVKQGLDVVLDAAARTRATADILYLLVGDGAMRQHLESRQRALGLTNVRIHPLLPRDAFLRLLSAADICVVTQQRTVADVVFPSKVVTLLAAGKPVVASVNGASAIAQTVADAAAGIVTAPEDASALAGAVEALLENPEQLRLMAANARRYARQKWDRARILQELDETFRQVTGTLAGISAPAAELPQLR